MANDSKDWSCSACLDDFPFSEKPCLLKFDEGVQPEMVCADCLRTQFLSAQANEIDYPVRWQSHILHPRRFRSAFDQSFVRAYEAKEKEYNTPAMQRAYCDCGKFVAPMVAADAMSSWRSLASSKLCSICEARWCLRCAQRCGGFGVPHECIPEQRLGERRLAFGGLNKGKDFQFCPGDGCGRAIELHSACNQMTCQCGVSFCYVCGVPAEADSGHWLRRPGGCPRFGVAGSEQVMFDDDFADIDDDDDNGAEEMVVWEQGDGELTTFDFNRWAWQAAMAEGTAYASQLDLMFGTRGDEAQFIDDVRRAMEMHHPVSHSGVSEEQWHMLAGQHGNAIERWLADLHFFVSSGAGTAAEHLGGSLLDFRPKHIFNVVVRADLEAGALWLREANESTLAWVQTQEPDIEFPGSAVFDVGPGGIPGQSWDIRDAGMFRDLPGLSLFKLAGGALLVVPKPQQVMEFEFDVGLLPQPTLRDNEQVQPEGQLPQEEDPILDAHAGNDDIFVLVKAGERQFFRRNEVPSAEWKESHPILWALFCPVPFIIDTVFVGRVNQQGYDQEYGLEFRADLNIPGSWPTEGGLEDSIYSDILAPGLYSQNVRLMRSVSLFACWFLVYSCFLDWRTAARNR